MNLVAFQRKTMLNKEMPKFRTSIEREQYKNQIVELYVQRKPQAEIAAVLGTSQATISQWVRKIIKEWRDVRFQNIDALKYEELQRINAMEAEMYRMWEASKGIKKKTNLAERIGKVTTVTTPGSPIPTYQHNPAAFREQTKTQDQEGNMEYWHAIQWCVDRRIKLLGMDTEQTKKIAFTDPTGTKEYGSGAREMLIQKIEDMMANRNEAEKRITSPPPAWTPKKLTEAALDAEVINPFDVEIQPDDDAVQKAIKRRAAEKIDV